MNKNIKNPKAGRLIPLTAFQEQIYIESSKNKNASYNMPRAYFISGKLDVACLNASFSEVLKKNSFLRTRLFTDSSTHSFESSADHSYSIECFDLSSHPTPLEKALEIYSSEEIVPINVLSWPLFRIKLIKLGADSFFIVFNFHHIIFDVRSWAVLFNQLELEYNAFLTDKSAANHVVEVEQWQENTGLDYIESRDFSPGLSDMTCPTSILKWKHLSDAQEASCAGGEYNWKIKGNDLRKFFERIKQLKIFPSSALMCAYAWTIFDFIESDSTNINFLIPSDLCEPDQIGCFLKSIDVNIENPRSNPRSYIDAEALKEFQKNFIRSCEVEDYKKFDIPKKLDTVDRRLAPLGFDYYQEAGGQLNKFSNLSLERVYTDTRTTKRYLTLSVKYFPRDSYMNLRFEYSNNIFDIDLVEKIKNKFCMYLHSITNI